MSNKERTQPLERRSICNVLEMCPVWMRFLVNCSFTTNKCGKSATKPRPLQAATPWFGRILMGQYFLAVLYLSIYLSIYLYIQCSPEACIYIKYVFSLWKLYWSIESSALWSLFPHSQWMFIAINMTNSVPLSEHPTVSQWERLKGPSKSYDLLNNYSSMPNYGLWLSYQMCNVKPID